MTTDAYGFSSLEPLPEPGPEPEVPAALEAPLPGPLPTEVGCEAPEPAAPSRPEKPREKRRDRARGASASETSLPGPGNPLRRKLLIGSGAAAALLVGGLAVFYAGSGASSAASEDDASEEALLADLMESRKTAAPESSSNADSPLSGQPAAAARQAWPMNESFVPGGLPNQHAIHYEAAGASAAPAPIQPVQYLRGSPAAAPAVWLAGTIEDDSDDFSRRAP